MRFSRLFGRTLRDDSSEAESLSHRFLLRSGMIHQLASGIYSYTPLAVRSLYKLQTIIREEMDRFGGQEVRLPALQPLQVWQQSGRDSSFGPDLIRLADRRGRAMVMAPTHEEAVVLLVKQFVQSYRDLPVILYQIQTKFRDEPRPRGGLIRVREFDMKDAYSFDVNEDGLDTSYENMTKAYENIFSRCGLPVVMVEADSGAIGGKDSHEFVLPSPIGEDFIVRCSSCSYAANIERATSVIPSSPAQNPLPLEETYTPDLTSINDVSRFLGLSKEATLKAVLYYADGELIFVSIRGDLSVNEVKLKRVLNAQDLRPANDDEIRQASIIPGYASPIGLTGIRILADNSVLSGTNFLVGANKPWYHLLNANYPRDFSVNQIADLASVEDGHLCVKCNAPLSLSRGIEVGHVFKLGSSFCESFSATYLDGEGHQQFPIMGCYGIGVGRLLAAVVEQNHDASGIIFPASVSPYEVYLAALNVEDPEVAEFANCLQRELEDANIEILLDDRQESPGVKLKDADLLGMPVRVVISRRTLTGGMIEVKRRIDTESEYVGHSDLIGRIKELLEAGS